MSLQLVINIQDHQIVKEEKPKVEVTAKPKGRHFQQSNSTQTANFKVLTTRLEDKVLNFVKLKHAAGFMKNCEEIDRFFTEN